MKLLTKGFNRFTIEFYTIVILISGSASAIAAKEFSIPDGVTVLSEEQLLNRLIGNTVTNLGNDAQRGYVEYYEPPKNDPKKGVIRGIYRKSNFSGSWKIEGNWFCIQYEPAYLAHWDSCYTIMMDGNRFTMYQEDGSTYYPFGGPLRMISGNPENL